MENLDKIMKKYFIIFLTILSYSQNKTIVPTTGTIVFEKKEVITDTLMYETSFEKIFESALPVMKRELLNEKDIGNCNIPDSINQQMDQILEMVKAMTMQEMFSNKQKDIVRFHHIYNGSEIEKHISSNNRFLKKEKLSTLDTLYNQTFSAVSEIKEYRMETRTIKGFKCFKIVMCYFDLEQPPGFNSLLNIMELWVTEYIKSKFHPFINESIILEKYYPLEIKHSIKNVEGMFTLYEISEFSIK
jgi:hypothetical protein